MNIKKIERYLKHLDRDALQQLLLFVIAEDGYDLVINMSEEWDKMYPPEEVENELY